MKEFIVYENKKKNVRIYIHKGRRDKGHKLCWYGIRRDDTTGLADWLGIIEFSPRWRQYVTVFEPNTQWSAGCKEKIAEFERMINTKWRKSLLRKRQQK